MKIINTDNFGSDYPNERFVTNLPVMSKEHAEAVCDAINKPLGEFDSRFWLVVPDDYQLQPGFQP